MAELRIFAVIGLLVCLAIVNSTAGGLVRDPCPWYVCVPNGSQGVVCGSDGETYPNKETLQCKICTEKIMIEVAHYGVCNKDKVESSNESENED